MRRARHTRWIRYAARYLTAGSQNDRPPEAVLTGKVAENDRARAHAVSE
jgi:hypothetical protein